MVDKDDGDVDTKKLESEVAKDIGGLDLMDLDGELKLTSKDGQEIMVPKKHAFISVLVKTSVENDSTATEVPLPGVEGAILKEVVRYMQHHKGTELPPVESPLKSTTMSKVCTDEWDATFIDDLGEIRQDLYDLILAANYMDIKSLLHLGLAKVASLIKGKPLDKLKEILSTDNDAKKRAAKLAKKSGSKEEVKDGGKDDGTKKVEANVETKKDT